MIKEQNQDSIDVIEFAEWIAKYQYEQDSKDKLWRYWDNGIGEYTTEELFNLFKQQQNGNKRSN